MRRRARWVILLLALIVVLALVFVIGQPWYWRAAPASPHAGLPTVPRSSSVLYEVFKPAIDPLNALIDYFRPSRLKQTACTLWPEWRLTLPWSCGS